MVAALLFNLESLTENPMFLLAGAFQLWMCIDAARRGEWIWAVWILCVPGVSILYFVMVYRAAPSAVQGFELPGSGRRRRIKELEAQIHNLDKAHHYLELGDIYFQQGKLDKAEANYRASLERDPGDIDAHAHFGQCLLRQRHPADARPWLQQVCEVNPKHDYGHSLMAYAETLQALGETDAAIRVWQQVLEDHSYARARVQLAQLRLSGGQRDQARAELQCVVSDDQHAPAFQRKRERVWVRKARGLLRTL